MLTIFRVLVLTFILVPAAALAAADDWQVVKATDQVKYSVDRTNWLGLRAGDVVPNRAWVSTGPRGRVQLGRGVESITFQPNSLASITTNGFFSRKTQIVQQIGSLDLEIEKRSQPHTTVQTPYLAAVVKGTVFHVTVAKTKASVSVDRGLVQVTSFASGQQSNVGPGQEASVDSKAGMTVAGEITKPQVRSVAPSIAMVPAVGTTKLAGTTDASNDKSKSSPASKGVNSSTNDDNGKSGGSGRSNSNGNGGDKGNGNSGGSGNGNGNSGGHGNNGIGNGAGNSNGDGGNGNSGSGNGNSGGNGNGSSGKGDNHSGGNSGGSGKGKDK
ncbi:hypothetical protein GFM14_24245 [Rhizobium leguminosarum bv. viciae]|uniref:FecR domain-containing protein n=1 Tax=Rhizobium leguminosarum TaxID=384 RepID=UPI000E0EE293|nr:FecR domain-containing protein [Rhizobium leguminosarum]MBY5494394.1 hypothetical protein [Rhizobium leguminosarum]NKJ94627.1 hypothetical protein [Rhizobium leguminosarum bv. viciae]TBZ40328.1 hypothetical protein E0H44_23720 [Rhizobium leguminosarum bv. viciae]TCA00476.1 hypothetical protein E0H68_37775 [Rhizobium leguminosarum bv. viciae]TCA19512.1 hypothetical protein E0H67_25150 [Rhizobium leguminosarum bv. viciae]